MAGSEAAHQVAKFSLKVILFEMRPKNSTPAHKTSGLAELICSNSLKSDALDNASGILKEEMWRMGSIVIDAADQTRVQAGKALAEDRVSFSIYLTKKLKNHSIEIVREEIKEIPEPRDGPVIIASGPLTSESLAEEIRKRLALLISTFTMRSPLSLTLIA